MSRPIDTVATGFELVDPVTFSLVLGFVLFATLASFGFLYVSRHQRGADNRDADVSAPKAPGWSLRTKTDRTKTDPAATERDAFLRSLDTVQSYVGRFYIFLLYLAMAAATGLMALLCFKHPDDSQRQFMLLFGGVVYVIAMLGLTTSVSRMRARLDRTSNAGSIPEFLSKISVTMDTSPHIQRVDDATLELAQRHLDRGGSIDDACAMVDARYRDMTGIMRTTFRKMVEMALDERRKSAAP